MKLAYAVVFEWAGTNYSAYVHDLPGCTSTGKSFDEVQKDIQEAIEGHIVLMRDTGEPVPEPTTKVGSVEVAA